MELLYNNRLMKLYPPQDIAWLLRQCRGTKQTNVFKDKNTMMIL